MFENLLLAADFSAFFKSFLSVAIEGIYQNTYKQPQQEVQRGGFEGI